MVRKEGMRMKSGLSFKSVSVILVALSLIGLFAFGVLTIPKMVNIAAESGLETLIEKVLPSVVHVQNDTMGWQGSGVAITKDIILTARHVTEHGTCFTITLNDGTTIQATQAISSKKYYMGFIKLDKPILTPAKFTSMDDCKLGTTVFVIGSPYGKIHFNSVTLGIISGLERDLEEFVAREGYPNSGWQITFQTDAAGHPGNSGCPVFTMDGKVRGILVAGFSPVLIHVVPAETVIQDLEQIKILFTMDDYYIEEHFQSEQEYYEYWNVPRTPRKPIWDEPFGPFNK